MSEHRGAGAPGRPEARISALVRPATHRRNQLSRMEPVCLGYPTEEALYWRDVEPRVLLKSWLGKYARATREHPPADPAAGLAA